MDNATIKEWIREGVELHLAGRREEAESRYRRVLEIEEGNPVVHNNLGFLLAQSGRWDDALGEYTRAIALDPEYSTPYSNLGQAYLALNKLPEAGFHLSRAIALDPEDLYANEGMGRLCLINGDLPASEEFLKRSYALEPKSELLFQLVVCLMGQEKMEEAKLVLGGMRPDDRADVRWHNLVGLIHFTENNFGEAGRCFRQALGLEPENIAVRNSLIAVLLKTGAIAEAVVELGRVLQLAPENLGALLNMGVLELMAQRPEPALGYLDRALAIAPGNTKAMYYKATALIRGNRKPAMARGLLQQVARSADGAYNEKAADLLKELDH
jgi:Flp pilus assembly protein TadD